MAAAPDDRALQARVDRAERLLRDVRHELDELTADAGALALALHEVLTRLARLDRLLRRLDAP